MTSMWVNYIVSGSVHGHNHAIVETNTPAACMEGII